MARPSKQTVEYFPHICVHGRTMFIVEQKYGNDGYAFWFKLLELLGCTNGHFLDLQDETTWEFLVAKTHLEEGLCQQILDLLAKLEAIDPELWREEKIVWCQKFVDNLASVYQKRKAETPNRDSFRCQKTTTEEVSGDDCFISDAETPQSKVKESKVKETRGSKVKEIKEKESIESKGNADPFSATPFSDPTPEPRPPQKLDPKDPQQLAVIKAEMKERMAALAESKRFGGDQA